MDTETLASASLDDFFYYFSEVHLHLMEMMTHPFGNFVVQCFLQRALRHAVQGVDEAIAMLESIAAVLEGNMLQLACHKYGCRVLQVAVHVYALFAPHICAERCAELCTTDAAAVAIFDQHAAFVVCKCIQFVAPNHICGLLDAIVLHFGQLSRHPKGCLVVKALFQYGKTDDPGCTTWQRAATAVMRDLAGLACEPNGNFVVKELLQRLFTTRDPSCTSPR